MDPGFAPRAPGMTDLYGCYRAKPDNWASGDLNGGGERDNHPSQFSLLTCLKDRLTWRATRLL